METRDGNQMYLLFKSADQPPWASMGTTLPQTEEAIRRALRPESLETFRLPRDSDFYAGWRGLHSNLRSAFYRSPGSLPIIILLDIFPSTFIFLRALRTLLPRDLAKVQVVIFAYGNFISSGDLWRKLEPELRGWNVRWMTTSTAQAGILRSCLLDADTAAISTAPIPIAKEFQFDPALRQQARARLGLDAKTRLFVCAGRIATEKNVDLLVKVFRRLVEGREPGDSKLLIAGSFDDEDGGLLRGLFPLGFRFSALRTEFLTAPDFGVAFLGALPREELRALYMAADVAVSFSLFHEEEFGLAIAESRQAGLPFLVTPWGGHLEHSEREDLGFERGPEGFRFDLSSLVTLFENVRVLSNEARAARSLAACAELGLAGIAEKLRHSFAEGGTPFRGFSKTLNLWQGLQHRMRELDPEAAWREYLKQSSLLLGAYEGGPRG